MLPLIQEYLAECDRQRVKPWQGFISYLSTSEINVDLDRVPVAAVRVFATALCRAGQRGPDTKVLRSEARGMCNERPMPKASRRAAFAGKTSTSGSSGHLVSLRIRHGMREHTTVSEHSKVASLRRTLPGASANRTSELGDRLVMRTLIDGVRHAVSDNRGYLVNFEFSGFKLAKDRESTARLMRSLPCCANLRALLLSGSSVSDELFGLLTSVPHSFPSLQEAAFAECGLTDASARGLRSLVLLSRESDMAWRQSLRGTSVSARLKDDHCCNKRPSTNFRGLVRLDVAGNVLSDRTMEALASVLVGDATLRHLDLSRNAITIRGLQSFLDCGALEGSTLESLDVSRNRLENIRGNGDLSVGGEVPAGLVIPSLVADRFYCIHHGMGQLLFARHQRSSKLDTRVVPGEQQPLSLVLPKEKSERSVVSTVDEEQMASVGSLGGQAITTQLPVDGSHYNALRPRGDVNDDGVTQRVQPNVVRDTEAEPITVRAHTSSVPASPATAGFHMRVPRSGDGPASGAAQLTPSDAPPYGSCMYIPLILTAPSPYNAFSCSAFPHSFPHHSAGAPAPTQVDKAVGTRDIVEHKAEGRDEGLSDELVNPVGEDGCTAEETAKGDDAMTSALLDPVLMTTPDKEDSGEDEGEQNFLSALVARLEDHENLLTERMEGNFRITSKRLEELRAELTAKVAELVCEQRQERETFAKQQEDQRRQVEERQTLCLHPEAGMMDQLIGLIHTGMARVQRQMTDREGGAHGPKKDGMPSTTLGEGGLPRSVFGNLVSKDPTAASEAAQQAQFVSAVNDRLKSLGW